MNSFSSSGVNTGAIEIVSLSIFPLKANGA
jgi:hypothetical protein